MPCHARSVMPNKEIPGFDHLPFAAGWDIGDLNGLKELMAHLIIEGKEICLASKPRSPVASLSGMDKYNLCA